METINDGYVKEMKLVTNIYQTLEKPQPTTGKCRTVTKAIGKAAELPGKNTKLSGITLRHQYVQQ